MSDLYISLVFQRFNLGVKLYYKVMEAMLKSVLVRFYLINSTVLCNDCLLICLFA